MIERYLQIAARQLFRTVLLIFVLNQSGILTGITIWGCFLIGFFSEIKNFTK